MQRSKADDYGKYRGVKSQRFAPIEEFHISTDERVSYVHKAHRHINARLDGNQEIIAIELPTAPPR